MRVNLLINNIYGISTYSDIYSINSVVGTSLYMHKVCRKTLLLMQNFYRLVKSNKILCL